MTTHISERLPNSEENDTEGEVFDSYLLKNNVEIGNSQALSMYQGSDTNDTSYVSAEEINHVLTLIELGEDSLYANENIYGESIVESNYKKSLNELDNHFNEKSYSFSKTSEVYKGVRNYVCFYKVLNIENKNVGDKIFFPGYLSTTASKRKAQDFIEHGGILLIISGLENSKCIIPRNTKILNSFRSSFDIFIVLSIK